VRRLALLLLLLAAVACSQQRVPDEAGTLVIGEQQEPISLNPALLNGQLSSQWGELLFSYLVKYDDNGRLVGDVASVVPTLQNGGISDRGLTITYHLRKGVRFADGVPLTARDCVWSIDAINDPENNVQSRYGYDRVARAYAPGPYTLVLHLTQPFAPIVSLVLAPQGFPILPAHLLARSPNFNEVPFDSQPIGSGPYVVERWVRGDRVEMRPNPYYFNRCRHDCIRHLVVKFVPVPQEAADQLSTHEIQAYFNEQDYSQYPILEALPGYYVLDTPVSAVGALIFNTRSAVTSDARVRHALAEAIDFPSVVRKAYRGALDFHDAGRGLFIWAFDAAAYPDVPYDPGRARALLDAAGWTMGSDGVRHRGGRAMDILLVIQAAVPGEAVVANNIVQYERVIGARVSIKEYDVTQFGAPASLGGPVYAGKFDLAQYSFVNGDDPDTTDQFACANVPPQGYNKSRICDPRIDALLREGRATYDQASRKAAYAKLQALLYRELPLVLLYQRRELDVFTDRLSGPNGSVDTVFWNVADWRLASPARRRP
jgi:peptide/nickel transport system substrate-binding protein